MTRDIAPCEHHSSFDSKSLFKILLSREYFVIRLRCYPISGPSSAEKSLHQRLGSHDNNRFGTSGD
ncbi:uncharacterized protein N7529_003061 [Penicillium soppii]|uniref:uncharacterized protein n=1 Tax=Penicillium soppii TaxID=69789 RepID=UPI002548EABA|nr:uncharacterized protein N7529_003061 [Penicillium soppii]KAJ5874631.1 hypothetical protein N7529_003061 [Penicillium soppii]